MALVFIPEVPRQHQVKLHAEESNGAHLEALEVPQNEALLHHHRHLGVFLRATLHILEDSLQLHLEKLLRVLPSVLLGSRARHPEEHCFKIQVHNQAQELKEFDIIPLHILE